MSKVMCSPKNKVVMKAFKVAARSSNKNSFGLRGHILIAEDGEAWEIAVSDLGATKLARTGTIRLPMHTGALMPSLRLCFELPRKLPNAPLNVVRSVWTPVRTKSRGVSKR